MKKGLTIFQNKKNRSISLALKKKISLCWNIIDFYNVFKKVDKTNEKITILRSPHVNKRARDQLDFFTISLKRIFIKMFTKKSIFINKLSLLKKPTSNLKSSLFGYFQPSEFLPLDLPVKEFFQLIFFLVLAVDALSPLQLDHVKSEEDPKVEKFMIRVIPSDKRELFNIIKVRNEKTTIGILLNYHYKDLVTRHGMTDMMDVTQLHRTVNRLVKQTIFLEGEKISEEACRDLMRTEIYTKNIYCRKGYKCK